MVDFEGNKYLAAILDSVIDAIIIIDREGKILLFNPAAESIFGYSASETLGRNVKMLMPEPYHSNHDKYLQAYLETGRKKIIGYGREAAGRKKDETIFPVDIAISEVRTDNAHCFVGIIRDISERKAAEEQIRLTLKELAQNRRDFLMVLNQLNQGVVMFNVDGEVTFINRSASGFLQLTNKECIGKKWEKIFPYKKSNIKRLQALLQVKVGSEKILVTCSNSSGETITHEFEVQSPPNHPEIKFFLITDLSAVYNLRRLVDDKYTFDRLIGKSEAMLRVFHKIAEFAKVSVTILIQGETGTGKELVARALHNLSARKKSPFIPVNCAGLTDTLIASQLFGHVKGAFTGADHDQKGLFEAANHGTIFLDEIGDISLALQTSLLRVLQQREYTRIGETIPRKVDVRVIAATNKDLELEVEQGAFRRDLLYRIKVATLHLPPLRERKEDIPLLANKFLQEFNIVLGKNVMDFSGEAIHKLVEYSWPGNVRELQNAVEVGVVSCQSTTLQSSDLPETIISPVPNSLFGKSDKKEKEKLLAVLSSCRGNKAAAAKILGMGRSTLYRRLREYKLV